VGSDLRPPTIFNDLKDIPMKESMGKSASAQRLSHAHASAPAANDNLDFNFVLDQEQVIQRLTNQLQSERAERRKTEQNYAS
jgi:hypothetical protein